MVLFLSGACTKQPAPEILYSQIRSNMRHGNLRTAGDLADAGYRRFRGKDLLWADRFRVLQGEVLMYRGLSQDSLQVLEPEVVPSLQFDDVAALRYLSQGMDYYHLQRFAESKNCLDKAEEIANAKSSSLRSEVAVNRGTVFAFQNDPTAARAQYRKALSLATSVGDTYFEGNALGGLGFSYMREERYDEAIDRFTAALEKSRTVNNPALTAVIISNLGWCYYKLGDLERASDLFQQAASLFEELGMLRQEREELNDLGLVHYDRQDYPAADQYFNKSLAVARHINDKAASAVCLNNLAMLSIDLKQFDKADQYTREAVDLNRADHDRPSELYSIHNAATIARGRGDFDKAESLLINLLRESTDSMWLRWMAQVDLADTYSDEKRTADADREFRTALATIDEARTAVGKEEYRLSFLNTATLFYNSYIDFLVEHGRANDALRIVEHSRARTLAEGLGLKSASLNSRLAPEQIARLSGAIVLEYWLKPGQSYLWAVTPSKVALFKLPADADINAAIQDYRKALVGPRDPLEAGNASGRKLYDMLVAPAQKLIRPGSRVIVIADGALNNLNFETLIVPTPKPHYWIDDVVLSDASSLALLAGSRHATPFRQRNLLLVGDPTSASPEYPRLPQAATEIDRVEQHFPAKARLVLEGAQATPQAYLASDTARFSYVHFVAHGTASRTTPLESAVILSPQGDSYKLYARDIVTKPLHADLVTISTCYGAGSRAYTGEGLVGLSWAFLRAGAHNTIAALWEVNDLSTAQLVDQLYTGIDKGKDPAAALRAAKLAMAHSDGIYRRPFYWAPFQLYQGS
jgi:CHAT domain-containing protein/Tfp pilus assembly protein PilF